MAWLKLVLPVLTLKDCLLAGNFFYHLLFLLSLAEMAARWTPSPRAAALFLFCATVFGGLDRVLYPLPRLAHMEWWMQERWRVLRQVSSFYSAMFWTVHHATALFGLTLAKLFAGWARFSSRRVKTAVLALLLAAAFYSSPFVFLPALVVAAPELWRLARRVVKLHVWPLPAAAALAPLFLFLNRPEAAALALRPAFLGGLGAAASFPLYLVLVSLVDFAGLPAALAWLCQRLAPREEDYATGCGVCLCLTWAVESVGTDNFSMRGMLPVSLIAFVLFARRLPRLPAWRVAAPAAVPLTVGTLKEAMFLSYQPMGHSVLYWRVRGVEPPAHVRAQLRPGYREAARGRATRYYTPDDGDRFTYTRFNAGRLLRDIPVARMTLPEGELLRHPRQGWFW